MSVGLGAVKAPSLDIFGSGVDGRSGIVREGQSLQWRLGQPWDAGLGAELFQHHKPELEVYREAARMWGHARHALMMVVSHPDDLRAAAGCGLRTASVARPLGRGPDHGMEPCTAGESDTACGSVLALAQPFRAAA